MRAKGLNFNIDDETAFDTLRHLAWINWHVDVPRLHVRRSYAFGKNRLIAEFLQCDEGSPWQKILSLPKGYNFLRVTSELFIKSTRDKRLAFLAREMKRGRDIISWKFSWQSGELMVTKQGGLEFSVSHPGQLFPHMSDAGKERIKDKDEKSNSKKKKT